MSPLGWGMGGTIMVAGLGAVLLRYPELAVLGGSGAAAALIAVVAVVRRPKVSVRVRVSPTRVVRDEPAFLKITIRNSSRWASPPFTLRLPHGPAPVRTGRPLPADSWSMRALVQSDLTEAWLARIGVSTAPDSSPGRTSHSEPARGSRRTGRSGRARAVPRADRVDPTSGGGEPQEFDGPHPVTDRPESAPVTAIEIARLAGGAEREIELSLDTNRRGVVVLGPAEVARTDPFGLVSRRQRLGVRDVLHVHPRVHPLASLSSAPSRDPDGQTGTGSAGGLEIHTLREYSPGEDLRLVHWPSSARVGGLMVRTHIDPSEPAATVVLDTRPVAYPPDRVGAEAFEEAVDVAAAAVMTCAEGSFGVRLVTTSGLRVTGRRRGRDVEVLLDELAAVQLHESASLDVIGTLRRGGLGTLVLVTGGFDREALAALASVSHAYGRVIVVRVGPRSTATARAFARRDSSDRARLRSSPPVRPTGSALLKRSLLGGPGGPGESIGDHRSAGRLTVIDVPSAAALPARWPAAGRDRLPWPGRPRRDGA